MEGIGSSVIQPVLCIRKSFLNRIAVLMRESHSTLIRLLVLASLVKGASLSNAVVVALPDNYRVRGKGQNALDSLSDGTVSTRCHSN
jgi:hypothetical protein